MQLHTCHNMDFLHNSLPDKCANLIISDPPYFEVKGEFDFIWATFDDYLKDVELWAKECKRLLTDNGTLFWWGHAKKIAYSQIILDKYFTLLNSLVWEKTECQHRRSDPTLMRTFAPVTERLLMYDNGLEPEEWCNFNESVNFVFQPILDWFLTEWQKSGLTRKQVDNACKTQNVTQYWFSKRNYQIPTKEKYEILQRISKNAFQKPYEALRAEYEALRAEYEALRRPFNQTILQTDVLKYSQEVHITKNYDHDTKKPETLTSSLILTCSRENDLVVVPFAGSGTECAMAEKYGRKWVGFEINSNHCDTTNKRANTHKQQTKLF